MDRLACCFQMLKKAALYVAVYTLGFERYRGFVDTRYYRPHQYSIPMPAHLGRLRKLTCVSRCQLHDSQQRGREATVTATWPSRRLTQSTRADAALGIHTSISWTLAMARLKRQTPSEYRWRCGSPAWGDSTNDLIAVIGAVAARKVN
jgi:hypothetical protein